MLPVDDALALVLSNAGPLGRESVDFAESTGRLLLEDVRSDLDLPPFPRSAVDGFAVRAGDLAEVPAKLRVVAEIAAGTFPDRPVGPGETAAIMTGAPVPDGADAVQMVEYSTREGELVELSRSVVSGQNVAPRASEVKRDQIVLRAGTRLDPAAVAVAATVGKTRLEVGRRPTAAVVATGDELVPPGSRPGPGQIRNSNGFSLTAQCRETGAVTSYLGVARDDEASIEELVRAGLERDVLLLSGGVSMGKFDLVEKVLEREGVRFHFDKIALKPGKPLVFGTAEGGTLVFGLPGNPVSTMVTFELFVRVALARLEGAVAPVRTLLEARLALPLGNRGPRRAYLPGWLSADDSGELVATPIPTRGSGDIVSFAKANALLIVPEDRDRPGARRARPRLPTRQLSRERGSMANDDKPALSHVSGGAARMVDVSGKDVTVRQATAAGSLSLSAEALALVREGRTAKGNVIETARLAGVLAAKRTSELVPLCHPLSIEYVDVDIRDEDDELRIVARVRSRGRTGVEMEALTAVSVAALTLYDMIKAADKTMVIGDIRLLEKEGGKSGHFVRPAEPGASG